MKLPDAFKKRPKIKKIGRDWVLFAWGFSIFCRTWEEAMMRLHPQVNLIASRSEVEAFIKNWKKVYADNQRTECVPSGPGTGQ